jgi:hypothetical protein
MKPFTLDEFSLESYLYSIQKGDSSFLASFNVNCSDVAFTADATLGTKVFWTGVTKSGCAGQFTDCFLEAGDINIGYKKIILPSDSGGSCVGVTNYGNSIIAKTVPCETTLFLACYGNNLRTDTSLEITFVNIQYLHFAKN